MCTLPTTAIILPRDARLSVSASERCAVDSVSVEHGLQAGFAAALAARHFRRNVRVCRIAMLRARCNCTTRRPCTEHAQTVAWHVRIGIKLKLAFGVQGALREGFDWNKGGKLPGLCAGECPTGCDRPSPSDGFSARVMWHNDAGVMLYTYAANMEGPKCGEETFPSAENKKYLEAGKDHTVRLVVALNSPSAAFCDVMTVLMHALAAL